MLPAMNGPMPDGGNRGDVIDHPDILIEDLCEDQAGAVKMIHHIGYIENILVIPDLMLQPRAFNTDAFEQPRAGGISGMMTRC